MDIKNYMPYNHSRLRVRDTHNLRFLKKQIAAARECDLNRY